ncbi:hypothetical protein ACIBCN_18615 [Nocardia sp. NPDC051052]|uniref:hypothetical protein n=1 Tax=Nocardia sp. NPDC051052 TaxID=3364322 RepID=UPI0037B665EC
MNTVPATAAASDQPPVTKSGLEAEIAVLDAVAAEKVRTLSQLAAAAQLTTGSARGAVARLMHRGLIVPRDTSARRGAFQITQRGQSMRNVKGRRVR